jgi:hypothetical protein
MKLTFWNANISKRTSHSKSRITQVHWELFRSNWLFCWLENECQVKIFSANWSSLYSTTPTIVNFTYLFQDTFQSYLVLYTILSTRELHQNHHATFTQSQTRSGAFLWNLISLNKTCFVSMKPISLCIYHWSILFPRSSLGPTIIESVSSVIVCQRFNLQLGL